MTIKKLTARKHYLIPIMLIFLCSCADGCKEEELTTTFVGDSNTYLAGDLWPGKNKGINGATTSTLLEKRGYDDLKYPDVIYLNIGVNDLAAGVSIPQIIKNYEELITEYKGAELHCIAVYPINKEKYKEFFKIESDHYKYATCENVANLNTQIKKLCDDYEVDFITVPFPCPNPYTKDGLHLNNKGYDMVMEAIGY